VRTGRLGPLDVDARDVGYRGLVEIDGTETIAWDADGFLAIKVSAPRRSRAELTEFARGVADVALLERTLVRLQGGLRERFPGAFDLLPQRHVREGEVPHVLVRLHPPKGEPNPDPGE
jgi:hypothetical protein